MISIRPVSLGGGFRYLMNSVAAGDGNPEPSKGLAHYYASTGTRPGVFLGKGLADLDDGRGVVPGSQVSEENLSNMLGACSDPVSGEPVGSRPRAPAGGAPVADFDLTSSISKSVSVMWALGDDETRNIIEKCHRQAIEFVISYAEREVFCSRSGTNGIVSEDVTGVVAASFTHFTSRADDCQLHDQGFMLEVVPGSEDLPILLAMTELPLADARNRLSELVADVEQTQERVMITKHGHPAAVLISPDDLASLEETLDVLSDADALADIREAEAEAARGEYTSAGQMHLLLEERRRRDSGAA